MENRAPDHSKPRDDSQYLEGSDLEGEAFRVRQQFRDALQDSASAGFPAWKKGLYLVAVLGVLFASVYLLIFPMGRKAFIREVVSMVVPVQEPEIFELPPPPPKTVVPKVQFEGATRYSDEEYTGILYSSSSPVEIDADAGDLSGEEEAPFVPPPKTEGSEAAFKLLREKSEVARSLIAGEVRDYSYQAWRPLKESPPVFLIEVIARKEEDNQDVHLVWEVNRESEKVTPLSQAARDLEISGAGSNIEETSQPSP